MKKVFPIVATVLVTGLVIISSCKKKDTNPVGNYTCHCSITAGGSTTTVDLPINNTAKNTATSTCASAQATYTTGGSTAVCTLN